MESSQKSCEISSMLSRMEADDWSTSSGGVSDPEACLEDSEEEELSYETSSLAKLQFRKHVLKACWRDEVGMAEVMEHKGRMLISMGIIRNGKIFCSIEETLFLAEIGALHLVDDQDSTIPIKEIYKKVAGENSGCSWEGFKVYRHLKSVGYIIGRHGIPWSLKSIRSCSISLGDTSVEDKSVKAALDESSIVQLLNDLHIGGSKPAFEVYLPNSQFRKTSPGNPSVVVYLARDHPPSKSEIEELERQCNDIPLKIVHVEHGRVSFFSFDKVELPALP